MIFMLIYPSKEFLEFFKKTPGALSVTESIAIMNIAIQAPKGIYIELGTHKGKSALSAVQTLKDGIFYLIDPIFENEELSSFVANMIFRSANNHISPRLIEDYSINFLNRHDLRNDKYAYVFVDSGSHGDGLPIQEVKLLEDRMVEGGIIAFHDFGNQFREPKEAAEYLVNTGKYEWILIDWDSIIKYVRENDLEKGNDSWHIYADNPFPNFVGAVKRLPN